MPKLRCSIKFGFHIPAWLSYFVSLSECAAAFLKGLKNKEKLKDFLNAYCAEPWKDYVEVRTEEAILKLRDHRPRGLVPSDQPVAGILGAIDTQDAGFYYELRAWGYGLQPSTWQIREGYALTFEALEQILFADVYKDAAGLRHVVNYAVIDAMGHRTKEVYDWCRKHYGRTQALQGVDRMNQPISYTKIDTYPGTNKPIPGGVMLLRANVTFFKNNLSNVLSIAPGDPGCWHLHSEATVDWCRQMTAEYVNENGLWVCKSGMANHAWDVSVYQLVAAEAVGIKFWQPVDPPEPEPKRSDLAGESWIENRNFKRPNWLNDR